MKRRFDLSEFVDILTEQTVTVELTDRVRKRRKEMKLTQKELAERSHVSYASLRRFESTGEISLSSLLKIARVIDCLSDFNGLFKYPKITSLKDYKP